MKAFLSQLTFYATVTTLTFTPAFAAPADTALQQQATVVQHATVEQQSDVNKQAIQNYTYSYNQIRTKVKVYENQLVQAQSTYEAAQGELKLAQQQVDNLHARLQVSQKSKDEITAHIDAQKKQLADTKSSLGKIARESYQNANSDSELSLLLSPENIDKIAHSNEMSEAALRDYKFQVEKFSGEKSMSENTQLRLVAIVQEIGVLKKQADQALLKVNEHMSAAQNAQEQISHLKKQAEAAVEELSAKRQTAIDGQLSLDKQKSELASAIQAYQRYQNATALAPSDQELNELRKSISLSTAELKKLIENQNSTAAYLDTQNIKPTSNTSNSSVSPAERSEVKKALEKAASKK